MSHRPIPCAICGAPCHPGSGSLPAGKIAHNKCRRAQHGTTSSYHRGCRCDQCVEAHRADHYKYRADANSRAGTPFTTSICIKCGEPLALRSKSSKPLHSRCKSGYIPGYARKRKEIEKRDQGTCQICLKPVEADARFGPLAPTLDHIVPVSHGGSHSIDNLRLAHRICNTTRGAARLPDSHFQAGEHQPTGA
ncbi:MAG: HNH endonuclease [Arthrobacter sp.]|nr:HNH endonuclease [Arthrobacter sp.]